MGHMDCGTRFCEADLTLIKQIIVKRRSSQGQGQVKKKVKKKERRLDFADCIVTTPLQYIPKVVSTSPTQIKEKERERKNERKKERQRKTK